MSDYAKVCNWLSFNKDFTDVPQNASEFSLPRGNSGLESSNRDFCCRICLQLNHEWHRHKLIPIDLLSKEKKRKEKTIWKFFWMVSWNGSNLMIFSFVTFLVFLCALWLLVPSPWAWFILENENSHPDSFIRDCRWQQF